MPNPKNPYPHEISFDQHVWLPSANENYVSMATAPTDHGQLQVIIENLWPEVTIPIPEHIHFVEQALMPRLSEEDVKSVSAKCTELGREPSHYNVIRIATHFFPEMRAKLGTLHINPPDDVHWMQRSLDYYIGDIFSSNMIISTLDKRDMRFEDGKKYLDFGCSSGSLIRALKAFQPGSFYYGADPLASSINWANANIPGSTFITSELKPPLPFEDHFFDGVTAVSIWSHFGEKEALAWFDDIHRCIKVGGWLCFTTHGRVSVSYYNKTTMKVEYRVRSILEGLINSDFVFEETYLGESPEGIDATGYGNAYFTREWVLRNLSDKWDLVSHDLGTNQRNQDIYILKVKAPNPVARKPATVELSAPVKPNRLFSFWRGN